MKIKTTILAAFIISLPVGAFAEKALPLNQEKTENLSKPIETKNEKISVQAKGMVCAFCAQGIEKKLKAIDGVSNIKVSLETKNIDFSVKEGSKLPDETIKKILTESGYEVVKIERNK